MKRLFAIFLVLPLVGCAQAQRAADWLASDNARQTAANLKGLVSAFDCGLVVAGAALSHSIASVVEAGDATISAAGKVYAVSAAVCEALGGAPSPAAVAVK